MPEHENTLQSFDAIMFESTSGTAMHAAAHV
jgi:hypothetical protein